jgi:hypothetical protein
MYNEQRPLYYVKETFFNQQAVDFNFYLPFFYRFNQSFITNNGHKLYGVALLVITKVPGERVTRVTFGGPLLTDDLVATSFRTENIPMKPTMVHFRDRLASILSLE